MESQYELTGPPTGDAVRLVIWYLDETFWAGTLGEEEAGRLPQLVPEHVAIVRLLSQRGIVSSVCSRNDPDVAQRLLRQHGVKDVFVFEAISCTEPKGEAVRRTLATLAVAPTQALLVDDSATCRAEARAWCPGLRTMHPALWRHATPSLWGLEDGGRRLKQLQGVVARKASAASAASTASSGESRRTFLHSCDVRVQLSPLRSPTDERWDRILELVQRSSRLNLTKRR